MHAYVVVLLMNKDLLWTCMTLKASTLKLGTEGHWQLGGVTKCHKMHTYHAGETLGRAASHHSCLTVCMSLYNPLPLSVRNVCDLFLTDYHKDDGMLDNRRASVSTLALETLLDDLKKLTCWGRLNSRDLRVASGSARQLPDDNQPEAGAFSSLKWKSKNSENRSEVGDGLFNSEASR